MQRNWLVDLTAIKVLILAVIQCTLNYLLSVTYSLHCLPQLIYFLAKIFFWYESKQPTASYSGYIYY